jgi:hypothetical protein
MLTQHALIARYSFPLNVYALALALEEGIDL